MQGACSKTTSYQQWVMEFMPQFQFKTFLCEIQTLPPCVSLGSLQLLSPGAWLATKKTV